MTYQARYYSPATRDEPADYDDWQDITQDDAIEICRLPWRRIEVREKPVAVNYL